jgi:SulP family sulfate permease
MTRPQIVAFEKVPGTSIWWPPGHSPKGETIDGVLVIAFQAPLSFLNAYAFQEGVQRVIRECPTSPSLIVLEASSITLRAQDGFERFGITDALPRTHLFHSVDEAIRALVKKSNEFGTKS